MALMLAPLSAKADITYNLVVPNPTGYGLTQTTSTPPPYGTVTVHLIDSKDALITFKAPATTYVPANSTTYPDYYSFIDGGMLAVNLSGGNNKGTNISYSHLVASNEGGVLSTQPTISRKYTGPSGNKNYVVAVSDFGKLNLVFNGPNFGTKSADIDQVSFKVTITDVSWAGWANELSVLTADNAGYLAAAHLVADIAGSPGFPPGGVALSGYAGNGMLPIPLPSTMLLLGSGLVGVGLLRVRRRQRKS